MLLLKLPLPVPSLVLVLNETVGFWLVLQTTPRATMLPPPSLVMLPPLLAVVAVMAEAAVVVSVGKFAGQMPPVVQVNTPLQKVRTWPCVWGAAKVTQLLPFQYMI